jgi:hypothetical protein
MSFIDPLPDDQLNPYAPPRTVLEPEADALARNPPRLIRMMRVIAAAHFGYGLFFCMFASLRFVG